MNRISLLDCTLRDGAYINGSSFGQAAIRGIIKKLQDAGVEIIECGWLKDACYTEGSTYYHLPSDMEKYLTDRDKRVTYVAMIDYDRYDDAVLPECDGRSIDAIRVVFPRGKADDALLIAKRIRDKGYKVYLQAANTLGYSDKELEELTGAVNEFRPEALSIVDTFGAMYEDNLTHIVEILDSRLRDEIGLGFHSHNNQQLSFALSTHFIKLMESKNRRIIVDSSLSGMGRGAGNTTTELMASYLNRKYHGNYDMDSILDAIDMYIGPIRARYKWGYSTPYFIAGLYQAHVNNIAYLLKNHRTNARDMRNVIESLSTEERRHYDYDLLEEKYIENQDRQIDDEEDKRNIIQMIGGRKVILIAPGKSVLTEYDRIKRFIEEEKPYVLGVNAIITDYLPFYDAVFFTNSIRYSYAKEAYPEEFSKVKRILLSNIKTRSNDELIVNFNLAVKRGWEHFDNAVICALWLLYRLEAEDVYLAGFDGFKASYNESYADPSLPTLNPGGKWEELNREIKDMFGDVTESTKNHMSISFLTESVFES